MRKGAISPAKCSRGAARTSGSRASSRGAAERDGRMADEGQLLSWVLPRVHRQGLRPVCPRGLRRARSRPAGGPGVGLLRLLRRAQDEPVASTALSGVNLALLEKEEPSDVVAPCPFCYRRLATAQEEMRQDPKLKAEVQEAIEAELSGELEIHNLVDFLREKVGLEAIAARLKKPLAGLKVVPYYGCFMVKPGQVTGCEDTENPTSWTNPRRARGRGPRLGLQDGVLRGRPVAEQDREGRRAPRAARPRGDVPWSRRRWSWRASSARPTSTCGRGRPRGRRGRATSCPSSTSPSSWGSRSGPHPGGARPEPPPRRPPRPAEEQGIDRMSKRVGVYICHCGTNIDGKVDVEKSPDEIGAEGGDVVVCRHYKYMCSEPGQKLDPGRHRRAEAGPRRRGLRALPRCTSPRSGTASRRPG